MSNMTPRKVAFILLDNWLNLCMNPYFMTHDQMSEILEEWGYKVTDRRREQIIEHIEKMLKPLRERVREQVENMDNEPDEVK